MRADLIFGGRRIYGVHRLDMLLGDVFTVELHELTTKVQWFSDQDPVLAMEVDPHGAFATITATAVGRSIIEIQVNGRVIGTLNIGVLADPNKAARLAPTVGAPEQQ